MFSLINNSLKYFNLMFLSAFHQLQYFSRVHMLCATCKSSPQVLRLKPWTCAGKKRRRIQMLRHRAGKEFAFISVLRLRFAAILCHWLHISVSLLDNTSHPPLAGSSSCMEEAVERLETKCPPWSTRTTRGWYLHGWHQVSFFSLWVLLWSQIYIAENMHKIS